MFITTLSITLIGFYDEQDKKEIVKIRESLDEIKQELIQTKTTLNEIKNQQKQIKVELPSQETLDYFVKVYKLSTEEKLSAEFIKNYEKDGRTHVIIQVNNKICDMPLLKTSSGWTANGVSCK
ncbi:hypothetical protein [Aliarcobacter butzleri]|uniref:Uncharacterized protein n=2 Tax=Aliarcobacter butzleri TaxID=28197 RepID=A0AAP4UZQ0_9BACT|nr:hypothetical protein [Aliarcobacter butzleri]MCG3681336.1 hypothetical protein [Aliarcobacter butzleri]MCG3687020.1 hypothetical protein [Aliarcobacter butzleri]MCG3710131.1 hypothetical protein [Aliarcobacter butzleri]MCG3714201.1 hypothetical protein [Aliarcobacter butzleri]MCT7575605.1 hypothetical protein [Aliarcobacter butzleri]